jgi:hypothetical protein
MEAEMYPLFGGYWGYMAAPMGKIQKQMLRLQGKWLAEKEANEDAERRSNY